MSLLETPDKNEASSGGFKSGLPACLDPTFFSFFATEPHHFPMLDDTRSSRALFQISLNSV